MYTRATHEAIIYIGTIKQYILLSMGQRFVGKYNDFALSLIRTTLYIHYVYIYIHNLFSNISTPVPFDLIYS